MTEPPLITIGLPVYNSERYLRQSLDSLLAQTYADFLLVISDNASTDGTQNICQEYANADSRVRYFRNPENIGNPRNFNRVFALTESRYLKWSTADDFWAPAFLERALDVMERNPGVVLCYPQAYFVDAEGGNPTPYEDCLHLVQEDPVERFISLLSHIGRAHQHLGLIRMSDLRRTHLLGTFVHSDINLLAELTLYGKFHEVPERLFFRRMHKTSGSWNRDSAEHNSKYYYGKSERNTNMARWRGQLAFFAAATAAPLPPRSKLRLYQYLLKSTFWSRRRLMGELVDWMRATGNGPAASARRD